MADIRTYIKDTLLDPLRYYPTAIQDTLLEIISERLETLYNYTIIFPEIVTPNSTRLDILRAIANQFLFTIRDEADIQEQIDILDNVLYVYNKRGSIDTIENMWKYYGGDLPKDVQVIIPSMSLFRWDVSPFSGTHVFQDGKLNRTGIYEIKLINSTYDIPRLREFLLKELVAAGNYIYFTNSIISDIRQGTSDSAYKYDIMKYDLLEIQMNVSPILHGINLSGYSDPLSGTYEEIRYQYHKLTEEQKASGKYDEIIRRYNLLTDPDVFSRWSGKENIFMDIVKKIEDSAVNDYKYLIDSLGFYRSKSPVINIINQSNSESKRENLLGICDRVYCTPKVDVPTIGHDLYNAEGQHIEEKFFILGETLLGTSLRYSIGEGNWENRRMFLTPLEQI